jgi:hypothetical protein
MIQAGDHPVMRRFARDHRQIFGSDALFQQCRGRSTACNDEIAYPGIYLLTNRQNVVDECDAATLNS